MTGTTLGSLYYMSPEQIQGSVNLDARSDLYSVGVSLYELVTGKRPFDGDSQFAIMSAHLKNTPVPPIAIDPSLPQALNDVILLSVAKDPNARFQGAPAFRNALSSIVPAAQSAPAPIAAAAAAPVMASPVSAMPTEFVPQAPHIIQHTAPRQHGSRRGLWMAIGGIATAAIVIGAVELAPWKGTRAAPPQQQPAAATTVQTPTPEPTPAPVQTPPAPAAAAVQQPVVEPAKTVRKQAASQQAAPVVRQPVPQPQTAPQQPAQPQSQAQPPVQAQVQAQPPTQAPAVDPAEVEKARDKYDQLQARATAIVNHSLFRSQAASGLGIRSDAATARSLMDTNMRNAADALNAGNASAARTFMSRAERQIEILEKILGI
jgi:serine/threonine-protein kinase